MIRPLLCLVVLSLSGCFNAQFDGTECGTCPTGERCEQLPDCHPAQTGPCVFACRPIPVTASDPDAGSTSTDPCGGTCLSHQRCENMPDCFPGMGPCRYVCVPALNGPTPSAH